MNALFPSYCRTLGYVILLLSIFISFTLFMTGTITDSNLILYKETIKLLIITGLAMILQARSKNENTETKLIRIKAMRNGFLLTLSYIFVSMVYKLYDPSASLADSSSFILFMALNVLCLEYGIKKNKADKLFKK